MVDFVCAVSVLLVCVLFVVALVSQVWLSFGAVGVLLLALVVTIALHVVERLC